MGSSPIDRDRLDPRNIELPDAHMIPILRAMSPAQRIAGLHALSRRARIFARGGIKMQYPHWTEEQIQQEITRRFSVARRRPDA